MYLHMYICTMLTYIYSQQTLWLLCTYLHMYVYLLGFRGAEEASKISPHRF